MSQVLKVNYTKYLLTILCLALLMLQQTQASMTILNSDIYTDYILIETSKVNENSTEDLNIKFFIGNRYEDPIPLGRLSGYSLIELIEQEEQLEFNSYLEYAMIAGGIVTSIVIGKQIGKIKFIKNISQRADDIGKGLLGTQAGITTKSSSIFGKLLATVYKKFNSPLLWTTTFLLASSGGYTGLRIFSDYFNDGELASTIEDFILLAQSNSDNLEISNNIVSFKGEEVERLKENLSIILREMEMKK